MDVDYLYGKYGQLISKPELFIHFSLRLSLSKWLKKHDWNDPDKIFPVSPDPNHIKSQTDSLQQQSSGLFWVAAKFPVETVHSFELFWGEDT